MKYNIYPFSLLPFDNGYHVSSNELSKNLWLSRPKDVAPKRLYYATGLVVYGPESVKVQVFGMRDMYRGGVGEVSFEYTPKTLTQKDQDLLDDYIKSKQTIRAMKEFQDRKNKLEAEQIEAIRKELFDDPAPTP